MASAGRFSPLGPLGTLDTSGALGAFKPASRPALERAFRPNENGVLVVSNNRGLLEHGTANSAAIAAERQCESMPLGQLRLHALR
jgi:hypothetical protein